MFDVALNYITKHRHSHFDLIWLLTAFYFFIQNAFMLGLIVLISGSLISVVLGVIVAKDAEWRRLASCGYRVEAIKEHRRVYGSTLKEAKDAVEDYMDRHTPY